MFEPHSFLESLERRIKLTEHARRLESMIKAFGAKKAEVDQALRLVQSRDEADALMEDLDDEDDRIIKELKRWCHPEMEGIIDDALPEQVALHTVDLGSVLTQAEPILTRARLLADWAQDDALDQTGADMIADLALDWVVFEIALTAKGIGRGEVGWTAGNDEGDRCAAVRCLSDLINAVRRDVAWFFYLPILGVELLDIFPGARMGMSHAAFAKRLGVAVELLRKVGPQPPLRRRPGPAGYSDEVISFALELREKYPQMKARAILAECRKMFPDEELPLDGNALRACMSRRRQRTNRTD
jgi:hypothetical protein